MSQLLYLLADLSVSPVAPLLLAFIAAGLLLVVDAAASELSA